MMELLHQMVCGYQKMVFAPKVWQGKVMLLTIEGAAHYAEVFVNGENVDLWDKEKPCLYQVRTELICDDTIQDIHAVRIGFRSVRFEKDGFYLNGKKVKIRGLNRHQSYPYVGYAMPKSMQEYDADILKKELGLNAVRTSHYPPSQYFLDRCDEIGLLVFTEIPGCG